MIKYKPLSPDEIVKYVSVNNNLSLKELVVKNESELLIVCVTGRKRLKRSCAKGCHNAPKRLIC